MNLKDEILIKSKIYCTFKKLNVDETKLSLNTLFSHLINLNYESSTTPPHQKRNQLYLALMLLKIITKKVQEIHET